MMDVWVGMKMVNSIDVSGNGGRKATSRNARKAVSGEFAAIDDSESKVCDLMTETSGARSSKSQKAGVYFGA